MFYKISAAKKLKKEGNKVLFSAKINLLKTRNNRGLSEVNLKYFDKKLLDYKKHYVFLTTGGIAFLGCFPVVKSKETPKTYQKMYAMDNIQDIDVFYTEDKVTYTNYKTETSYRTVRTQSGHSYREELTEEKPYETTTNVQTVQYVCVNFKNLVNDISGYFSFVTKKEEKSIKLVNKMVKCCNKLNINCNVREEV